MDFACSVIKFATVSSSIGAGTIAPIAISHAAIVCPPQT
jgi:hypothetical protein